MPLTADFEKGTNGATIATTDAGSLTAWDVVSGTPTYDTTHVAHGTLAASEASNARPSWTTALGTITADYGRLYIYPTAFTSAAFVMRYSSNPISSTYFNLKWNDTLGHLNVLNGATGLGTFTNAVVANQWNRIEWHVVFSTTGSGLFEVKLFTSLDSATATETKTFSSLTTSTASAAGWEPISTNGTTVWYDQLVIRASAYPGPFPVNSVAPTVSGSTPVGSTLTANAGTWNGTYTLTYQWQKDGVNIAGATGTTYVTVSGDVGHAIGVVETATGVQATNETAATASSNTITVASSAPANTVAPAVTGTTIIGNALSCTTGTWTGDVSSGYAYQWKNASGNITGATSATYTLVTGDLASNIHCTVTATGTGGSTSADSNTVGPITEPAPTNTVAPVVSGATVVGSTLTTTDGTWV